MFEVPRSRVNYVLLPDHCFRCFILTSATFCNKKRANAIYIAVASKLTVGDHFFQRQASTPVHHVWCMQWVLQQWLHFSRGALSCLPGTITSEKVNMNYVIIRNSDYKPRLGWRSVMRKAFDCLNAPLFLYLRLFCSALNRFLFTAFLATIFACTSPKIKLLD